MPSKRKIFVCLGFLISAIIIAIILWYSDFGSVLQYMAGANLIYLGIVLCFMVTLLLIKSLRWFLILRSAGINVSVKSAVVSFLSGLTLSTFSPGRVGEPIRVYFLKRMTGQEMSKTLSPVIMERAIDFLVILLFISSGLVFFAINFGQQIITFSLLAIVFGVLVVLILVMILKKGVGIFFFNKFSRRIKFLRNINIDMFYDTIARISFASVFGFFLLTVFIWIMESFVFFFALMSVGVYVPINICIFIFPTAVLIGIVSFLPGSLGSFEASSVVMILAFITANVSAITGGIFLYSIIMHLVIVLMGGMSLFFVRKKKQ